MKTVKEIIEELSQLLGIESTERIKKDGIIEKIFLIDGITDTIQIGRKLRDFFEKRNLEMIGFDPTAFGIWIYPKSIIGVTITRHQNSVWVGLCFYLCEA